jgi:hypothetical protein
MGSQVYVIAGGARFDLDRSPDRRIVCVGGIGSGAGWNAAATNLRYTSKINWETTMKRFVFVIAAICLSFTAAGVYAEDPPGGVVTEVAETVVTVTAVDQKARTVTVERQDGELVTIQVPPQSQNLDQVYPGARFLVRYLQSVAIFISPTGGEPSSDVTSSVQMAEKGANPGGVITQVIQVQVRVDAIDYENRTVVLTGPEGNSFKLAVDERVKRLNEVKVGDIVVVGYTQALAAEMIRK